MALLFAGVDETGPHLYHLEPSGTYIEFEAKAIGSGSEGAQQNLQDIYHKVCISKSQQTFSLIFYFKIDCQQQQQQQQVDDP